MSLWHCKEHGLVGPEACCPSASLASIGEISATVPSRPARDGETLSDERRIDELLREFQMACEDAAEFNADSIRASAKHRAILRNELRSELLAVAALLAELAEARADTERLDWLGSHLRYAMVQTDSAAMMSLPNNGRGWENGELRQALDAARAASGEDASHE